MYLIKGAHIFNSELKGSKGYYIREILDFSSSEYQQSKLTPQEKYLIISELGLERLTAVLDDAFRSSNKGYNAEKEAYLTYELLKN